jgi:demethylmenaquinone methyltransferase / 2-methoxy-6-polyprenyl-1,4-benzoquinol methylase
MPKNAVHQETPDAETAEKAAFVQGLFNRLSPSYDRLNQWISMGQHWGWKKEACQQLALQPGGTVLDVCTGTGDLASLLAGMVGANGQVVGLDFSEGMLATARKRFATTSNCQWVQGDALALPFEANTFNGAVIAFGLRNVVNREKAIAEMQRVVKPGARVVCLETNPKPKLPGFWLYFKYVMPRLGQWLANDLDAYQYLQASTENFLTPHQVVELFKACGLSQVHSKPLSLGACSLTIGVKA